MCALVTLHQYQCLLGAILRKTVLQCHILCACIQLTKPGTWVPLIWGVACGAAASGNYRWPFLSGTLSEGAEDFAKAATCMVLSGPFLTGFCQTINDWRRRGVRFRT